MKKLIVPLLAAGFGFGAAVARGAEAPATPPPAAPATLPHLAAGQTAPAFTLPDVDNKNQSLASFRGKPVAAFFFCGCRLCHKCARAWNDIQRSGALPQGAAEPVTIVIFHGNAKETRTFAEETQLDPKRTVLLADLKEDVTESYQADPCPRVFVIDREGVVRYTNDEQGADSNKIPAPLIVARTVNALRGLPAAKAAAPAKKPIMPRSGNKVAQKSSQHR